MDELTIKARQFVQKVSELAASYNLNFFVVTDGASAISNTGNLAVEHARQCHEVWEQENGIDSVHDWSKE